MSDGRVSRAMEIAALKHLLDLTAKIHSAENIDLIFTEVSADLLKLFNAERSTIYAINQSTNELYSRVAIGGKMQLIRVGINPRSMAGYVAMSNQLINIRDVHDAAELRRYHPELHFDDSWDKKSGFVTRNALGVPIICDGAIRGVIQIINKTRGDMFVKADERNLQEIARSLGVAFRNQNRQVNNQFQYLIQQDLLSEKDLQSAASLIDTRGGDLVMLLMDKFNVKKKDIGASLSHYYQVPFVPFQSSYTPQPGLAIGLKPTFLRKSSWAPVGYKDGHWTVVIDNPKDVKAFGIAPLLRQRKDLPFKGINFAVALRADVNLFITALMERGGFQLEGPPPDPSSAVERVVSKLESTSEMEARMVSGTGTEERENPIIRLANQVIIKAAELGASDIHVEPSLVEKAVRIRLRVDGVCQEFLTLPYATANPLVSRYKIMSHLDISEKRLPQDGKIKFNEGNTKLELRVATLPTVGGEAVVMRLLAASEPMPLEALNLSERNYEEIKRIAIKPHGIVLVVGPTGSGKTTSLHSVLGFINTPDRKIWTAEDPVEITQKGLAQLEVKKRIDLDFKRALRAFLRADPDVIMIGEMRDLETAAMGVEASLTGHLVLSTLHTNSAPETVTRLMDLGLDPFNFADALNGVLAQRLIRTLCKKCKEPYKPSTDEFLTLVRLYGEELFPEIGVELSSATLYRKKGCSACNNNGYKGRTGVHELLVSTPEMMELIQAKAQVSEMRAQAIKDGMRELRQDAIIKLFKGQTDFDEVRRVTV